MLGGVGRRALPFRGSGGRESTRAGVFLLEVL